MQDTPSSYVAEPTPGTCILCPDPEKARVPYYPPVCSACRSWLAGLIADIRILHEELEAPEPVVRDDRTGTTQRTVWQKFQGWVQTTREGWRDPAAHAVPAAPTAGENREPRVSGTHGAPVPANLARVDLTLPSNPGSVAPHTRGLLGLGHPAGLWEADDQVGDLPLSTVLEGWVQEWRRARDRGEGLPDPTVDAMTRWLGTRVEWACDDYSEVASFADEMRTYRSAMRRVLGLSERPEYKTGVACPKCQRRTLLRRNGSEWVECASCPAILSPAEYSAHAGEEAAGVDTPDRAA